MGKAMDFQKLRSRRRRGIFLKRLIILGVIVAGVFAVMSLNTFLVAWQLPTQVTGFLQGFGGPGYPVHLPGGALRDVKALGNDVAVLNDGNLFLFNRNGREMLSVQRVHENTVLLAGGNRMLTYSVGAPGFQIYLQGRLLLDGEHSGSILAAALGERGNYALVSSSIQHVSEVMVFDEQFEQRFGWGTRELVAFVDLDPRGTGMAVGSVGVRGGELRSTVSIFDITVEEEPIRVDFADELILSLSYLGHAQIAVITDKGLRVLDAARGNLLGRYDLTGGRVSLSRVSGEHILLYIEDPRYRQMRAVLFGARGQELGQVSLEMEARDMQVGGRGVYILTAVGVRRFDLAMNPQGKIERSGIARILLAGNVLYYVSQEEIAVFAQSDWEDEE